MIATINYVEQSKDTPSKFTKVVLGLNVNPTLFHTELKTEELKVLRDTIEKYLVNMI